MSISPGIPPVIGISTYREQTRFRMWDLTADVLPAAYARSVEAVGGAVLLLPPKRPPRHLWWSAGWTG